MKIVDYTTTSGHLTLYPGLTYLPLNGEISLKLMGRGCAGRWDGETYVPCASPMAPYCPKCREVWPCALCTGECLLSEPICLEEHSVYLALFRPDIVKVGVTKTRRLKNRLREQGADVGVEVMRVADGREARVIERDLAKLIPDRVTAVEKLDGFDRPIDETKWSWVKKEVADHLDVGLSSDVMLTYFDRDLWMRPIPIVPSVGSVITGMVFGIKGRQMVVERIGSLYAVDLKLLMGFEIEQESTGGTSIQSSLHSF